MKHAGTAFLVVMLFSTLGLWGIAQQKNGAYAGRLRDLEARQTKFEDEHRTFAQQADKNQRRIASLENEKAELTQVVEELKVVVVERDGLRLKVADLTKERTELRGQLSSRTQERDQVSQEMKQFSQELQSLLGRMETSLANSAKNGNTVEGTPASRRSE